MEIELEIKKSLYGSLGDLEQLEYMLLSIEHEQDHEKLGQQSSELIAFIASKVDACCYYDQLIEDQELILSRRIDELKVVKKSVESKRDRFHQYLLSCLDRIGVDRLSGSHKSFSKRKPSKVVKIIDDKSIPIQFLKVVTETKVDVLSVKQALKLGELVDGAALVDGKTSLIFKDGVL